jgi:hypothetical protein
MNFNPFNKPPLNKIFTKGNGQSLENTAPESHESEKGLLSKLAFIISFLAVMGSAEAKSPALREFSSFEDFQSKTKNEFVKLQEKMTEMNTDTVRYETPGKKIMFISHNGTHKLIEQGGGNTVILEDRNGDFLVDVADMEGYLDAAVTVKPDDHQKVEPVQLKRIKVVHKFSDNINSLAHVKTTSTMSLTEAEEIKAFLSSQEKFVQAAENAYKSLENSGAALAQQ